MYLYHIEINCQFEIARKPARNQKSMLKASTLINALCQKHLSFLYLMSKTCDPSSPRSKLLTCSKLQLYLVLYFSFLNPIKQILYQKANMYYQIPVLLNLWHFCYLSYWSVRKTTLNDLIYEYRWFSTTFWIKIELVSILSSQSRPKIEFEINFCYWIGY